MKKKEEDMEESGNNPKDIKGKDIINSIRCSDFLYTGDNAMEHE